MRLDISLYKFLIDSLFRIRALVTVSGNPPLLVIITAHPLAEASRLVLQKVLPNENKPRILVCLNILKLFMI